MLLLSLSWEQLIRIHHEYVDRIDKFVSRVTVLASLGS